MDCSHVSVRLSMHIRYKIFTPPSREAEYCDEHMSVSLPASISLKPHSQRRQIVCACSAWSWLGRTTADSDKLCTASFVDDVAFSYHGPCGGMSIIIINSKNCSLSIVSTATDQKPQKSLKRSYYSASLDIQAM